MHKITPRKPLFALAMSLVLPGFGQLYNGEVNKAIWLFLGFALLSVPGVVLVALYLPNGWMMPALLSSMAATLSLWFYGMFDAWRGARRRQDYRPGPWQLGSVYLLVLILCDVLALPLLTNFVREHQVESFRIPSASMEPTVLTGDILFADKRYNCGGCKHAIRRGDIAIFTYPNDRTLKYIKRIIALPGDHVQISDQTVRVNGAVLNTATADAAGKEAVEQENGRCWRVQWGEAGDTATDLIVPPGQVFVLGDNRSHSTDSRKFGVVPMQDVVGRARQIWFSKGADGVRWGRMGLVFE